MAETRVQVVDSVAPQPVATTDNPFMITVVSGKGGVGKTMLSVAIATELALGVKTLIVDLDFFNRGLTGLMRHGTEVTEIEPPAFSVHDAASAGDTENSWRLLRVKENLYHIHYPDLTEEEISRFATMKVSQLRDVLERFVLAAARRCGARCIVMDCHGGPDNSSFAACLFSDTSILVSEPDRITLYGTLHFMRQLESAAGERPMDVHFAFNKVVPQFSGLFLTRYYDRYLRPVFGGHDILAIYPLELYLTKEFEKTPFLCEVYPHSFLARKTRVLLYDLLCGRASPSAGAGVSSELLSGLPATVRTIPRWTRVYRRLTLGRTPWIFHPAVATTLLAGFSFVSLMVIAYRSNIDAFLTSAGFDFSSQLAIIEDVTDDVGAVFLSLLLLWVVLPIQCRTATHLIRRATYYVRKGSGIIAGLIYLSHFIMWSAAISILYVLIAESDFQYEYENWLDGYSSTDEFLNGLLLDTPFLIILSVGLTWFGYFAVQIFIAQRGVRQEVLTRDSAALLVFSLGITLILCLSVISSIGVAFSSYPW